MFDNEIGDTYCTTQVISILKTGRQIHYNKQLKRSEACFVN